METDKNHDKNCQIMIAPESLDLDMSSNSCSLWLKSNLQILQKEGGNNREQAKRSSTLHHAKEKGVQNALFNITLTTIVVEKIDLKLAV